MQGFFNIPASAYDLCQNSLTEQLPVMVGVDKTNAPLEHNPATKVPHELAKGLMPNKALTAKNKKNKYGSSRKQPLPYDSQETSLSLRPQKPEEKQWKHNQKRSLKDKILINSLLTKF